MDVGDGTNPTGVHWNGYLESDSKNASTTNMSDLSRWAESLGFFSSNVACLLLSSSWRKGNDPRMRMYRSIRGTSSTALAGRSML